MMLLAPDWLNNAGRCRRCHFSLNGAATVGVCGWGQVCSACVDDMRTNARRASQSADDLVGDLRLRPSRSPTPRLATLKTRDRMLNQTNQLLYQTK